MAKSKAAKVAREDRDDIDYQTAWCIADFVEDLSARMESKRIRRAELARRLKKSAAYVTKILRAESNFTLKSMVNLAMQVDCVMRIHLAPRGASTRWIDAWDGVAVVDSANQMAVYPRGQFFAVRSAAVRIGTPESADPPQYAAGGGR